MSKATLCRVGMIMGISGKVFRSSAHSLKE
ncbi:hypothetical protein D9758_018868 [Tetrapyrgos nigripes]|uniref:Uncharacterized protein n=1 Tax=Tetrapyrgos nigripes TaxID=182062 RepID=A0A8H5BDC4_9AGAR|nr:hypothetical protein D9758_018868 [Tetrapyrgos nigripes]